MSATALSNKQSLSLIDSNSRYNIWVGSVRSGKTHASLLRFLDFIKNGPTGDVMLIGVSRDSIQRNVISSLYDMLAARAPGPRTSQVQLYNRNVYFVGAYDEGTVRKIQGSTLACAYIDELTSIPRSFFRMLQSRLSVKGAKLFATCNPEGPAHWVKKELLDKAEELDIRYFQFNLEDNPALPDEYKASLKKEYSGMWYKRYILGEWSVATGAIYDSFDEDNIFEDRAVNPRRYVAGIDYGTVNATSCLLAAINEAEFPQIQIEREYYYDSMRSGRQKTDAELADDLQRFLSAYSVDAIYVDPAAASLKLELRNRNLPVVDARNEVLTGIQHVAKFIQGKNLQVHSSCTDLIDQLQTYAWDAKSAERGVDKPVKENDHCFVAGTQVLTERGHVAIEDVTTDDRVLTRNSFQRVLRTGSNVKEVKGYVINGREIVCTPDHRFWTVNKGWVEVDKLEFGDFLLAEYNQAKAIRYIQGIELKSEERIQTVYNLDVEHDHEFFAEGMLVHNSVDSLRYLVNSVFPTGQFSDANEFKSHDELLRYVYSDDMSALEGPGILI